jgi:hypothetical protein
MPKYMKKPVVIEAKRFDGDVVQSAALLQGQGRTFLEQWCGGTILYSAGGVTLRIPTLEGNMDAGVGDWIIRGVQGEFYPCKPDIFAATYELVADV